MNSSRPSGEPRFVVCVEVPDEYAIDLALHKIYEVVPDAGAERSGWIRIVDETGEDYLYSDALFRQIEVPQGLWTELWKAS